MNEEQRQAARRLGAELARIAASPQGRAVIAGLERAMPELAEQVRAAMTDPAAALGKVLGQAARNVDADLRRSDRVLAKALRKALR